MYMEEDGSGETVIEKYWSWKLPHPTPSHDQTPVSTSAGEINEGPNP